MFLIGLVNSIPQKLDKENIYIHDDVLLYYRIHNNQVTTNNQVGLNR